mmetsp:Transcript_26161/g.59701  ORF Transcript_26161/g.59701 Transcript_26161/m.59701 type:complete len:238 (+) Transcript_26161:133-846(+)
MATDHLRDISDRGGVPRRAGRGAARRGTSLRRALPQNRALDILAVALDRERHLRACRALDERRNVRCLHGTHRHPVHGHQNVVNLHASSRAGGARRESGHHEGVVFVHAPRDAAPHRGLVVGGRRCGRRRALLCDLHLGVWMLHSRHRRHLVPHNLRDLLGWRRLGWRRRAGIAVVDPEPESNLDFARLIIIPQKLPPFGRVRREHIPPHRPPCIRELGEREADMPHGARGPAGGVG